MEISARQWSETFIELGDSAVPGSWLYLGCH